MEKMNEKYICKTDWVPVPFDMEKHRANPLKFKKNWFLIKLNNYLDNVQIKYQEVSKLVTNTLGFISPDLFPVNIDEMENNVRKFETEFKEMEWPREFSLFLFYPVQDERKQAADTIRLLYDYIAKFKALRAKTLTKHADKPLAKILLNHFERIKSEKEVGIKAKILDVAMRIMHENPVERALIIRKEQINLLKNHADVFQELPEYLDNDETLAKYFHRFDHDQIDKLFEGMITNELLEKLKRKENIAELSPFEIVDKFFEDIDESTPQSIFDVIDREALKATFREAYRERMHERMQTTLTRCKGIGRVCNIIVAMFAALLGRAAWLRNKGKEIFDFIVCDLGIKEFMKSLRSLQSAISFFLEKKNHIEMGKKIKEYYENKRFFRNYFGKICFC